eukprot:TRINITY_DN108214_c0_g1_i1.p1 TRINITY_DN108214_c0_g1~~TRINITY_DN108214_c0_g1_i1.p1  ORF type:complete len:314 (-),score=55.67 TRINITY_DN108214_c0_g1_i1:8-919(-)
MAYAAVSHASWPQAVALPLLARRCSSRPVSAAETLRRAGFSQSLSGVVSLLLASGSAMAARVSRRPHRQCVPAQGLVAGAEAAARADHKVVHFVRHAEAEVNAAGRVFPKDDPRKKAVRLDSKFFDSELSEKGLLQCKQLRAGTLEGRAVPPAVEIVAASPLTRALQTATAVFGCGEPGCPQLFALEALREFCGKNFQPCDSRRPPEILFYRDFAHVDFQNVPRGADQLLKPGVVEAPESADSRIRQLLEWIRTRPERSIACVGHFQILSRVFSKHLEPAGWDSSQYGDLTNLEIRTVPLAFD